MAEVLNADLYPLDITGQADTNEVLNERHTLSPPSDPFDFHFIVPIAAPYFRDSVTIRHVATGRTLIRGVDWTPSHRFYAASDELQYTEGGVYASIMFLDIALEGDIEILSYQTIGGGWLMDEARRLDIMSLRSTDPRSSSYEEVSGNPTSFSTQELYHDLEFGTAQVLAAVQEIMSALNESTTSWLMDPILLPNQYYTMEEFSAKLDEISQEVGDKLSVMTALINAHVANYNNPHRLTKKQIQLGNVENYPVANEQEAREGLVDNRYMTPRRSWQSFDSFSGKGVYDPRYDLKGEGNDVSLAGPKTVYQGVNASWIITNYDRFSTYEVSVDQGNVAISGDTISYAMPLGQTITSQTMNLTVVRNGYPRTVEIVLLKAGIKTPTIISPLQGESISSFSPTISVAAFETIPELTDTHISTDWVIATDASFQNIVFQSLNDTVNKTSIVASGLSAGVSYYLRVRFNGAIYPSSDWASIGFNTVNQWTTSYVTEHVTSWTTGFISTTSMTTSWMTDQFANTSVQTSRSTDATITTSWDTAVDTEVFATTSFDTLRNTEATITTSWDTEYPESEPGAGDGGLMQTSMETLSLVETSVQTSRTTSLGLVPTLYSTSRDTQAVITTSFDTLRSTLVGQVNTSAITYYDTNVGQEVSRTTRYQAYKTTSLNTSRVTSASLNTTYGTSYSTAASLVTYQNTQISAIATWRSTSVSVAMSRTTSHLTGSSVLTSWTTGWNTDYAFTTSYSTIEYQATTGQTTSYQVSRTTSQITRADGGWRIRWTEDYDWQAGATSWRWTRVTVWYSGGNFLYGSGSSNSTVYRPDRPNYDPLGLTPLLDITTSWNTTEVAYYNTYWDTSSYRTTSHQTSTPVWTQAWTSAYTGAGVTTSYGTSWSSVSYADTWYYTYDYRSTAVLTASSRTTSHNTSRSTIADITTSYGTYWNTLSAWDQTTNWITNSSLVTSRTTQYETQNITNV